MRERDLPLMHEWLQRPHVRRWWNERETYEEVVEHYLSALEGSKPTDLYIVVHEDRPIGFIQTYRVADHQEYADLVGASPDETGVDLFIADEELTGRGLGTEILRRFVSDVVFADPATRSCIADPERQNVASVRAFEKAGFQAVREFVDPEDGKPHVLVRRQRSV